MSYRLVKKSCKIERGNFVSIWFAEAVHLANIFCVMSLALIIFHSFEKQI